MEKTTKKMDITRHNDGTVTYFCVYSQVWRRRKSTSIVAGVDWVASFTDAERAAVLRHAEKHA